MEGERFCPRSISFDEESGELRVTETEGNNTDCVTNMETDTQKEKKQTVRHVHRQN